MAMCPYCHDDKPMVAPVCTNCNHDTPFLFQVGFSFLFSVFELAFFVGAVALFIAVF